MTSSAANALHIVHIVTRNQPGGSARNIGAQLEWEVEQGCRVELVVGGHEAGAAIPPGVTVQTADLSGRHLDMVGVATIRIDANAASWGRIFYATPLDDEFPAPGDPGGQGRMNVLTVLKPESGQVPDFNSQEVKTLDTTAWLTAAAVASPRNYWDGLDLAFVPPDRVWADFLK